MKKFSKTLLVLSLSTVFIIASGCQEKDQNNTSSTTLNSNSSAEKNNKSTTNSSTTSPKIIKTSAKANPKQTSKPRIKFEKLVHDFGALPVKTSAKCEFKFKNTGNSTLIFPKKPRASCGCTVIQLDKMEYAPGESGSIKVNYRGELSPARIEKHITVFSNDPERPSIRLAVAAEIQTRIIVDPEILDLKLNLDNAGAGPITVSSRDGKPFAITGFQSTGSTMTADFNTEKKAVKHTINPKVDLKKLRKILNGNITINCDHPRTKQMLLRYKTTPPWRLSSTKITLLNPTPDKPVTREIMVLSNYGEKVEIESARSAKNCIKLLRQEEKGNGVNMVIEVTPTKKKNMTFFYDHLTINLKSGDTLTIIASGMFKFKKSHETSTVRISN